MLGVDSVSLCVRQAHLTVEELAAYLDGVIRPEERVRVEAHLSACGQCFEELVALLKIIRLPGDGASGKGPTDPPHKDPP